MCSFVPGEVLRQCSTVNPADIYVPSIRSLQRSFMYASEVHSYIANSNHIYMYLLLP